MTAPADRPLDVLVIGGGQAGLVMGYQLAQRGQRFLILDAGAEIGAAWRSRWDSLVLFTPAQYDNLPGLPFPAAPDTYPGKDDVANYLQNYAAAFDLPVRLNTTVTSLSKTDGGYVAERGRRHGRGSAGGGRHRTVPRPVHPSDRRPARPRCLPGPQRPVPKPRADSHRAGCWWSAPRTPAAKSRRSSPRTHQVELSAGARIPTIPQRPLGRDVWWWASGAAAGPGHRRLPTRASGWPDGTNGSESAPGTWPDTTTCGSGRGPSPPPAGPSASPTAPRPTFDAVVWATGYTTNHSWIDIPEATDRHGHLVQKRGVTPSPGLYTLGLTWQHTRGSALLGWVGADAAYLADQITSRDATQQRAEGPPTARTRRRHRHAGLAVRDGPMSLTTPRRLGIRSGCAASPASCAGWRSTRTAPQVRPSSGDGSMRCWTLINGEH